MPKSIDWNTCIGSNVCVKCVLHQMNIGRVKVTVVFGKVSCLLRTFFINYLLCLECDKIIYYFDEMCRCNFLLHHVFIVYTVHTHTQYDRWNLVSKVFFTWTSPSWLLWFTTAKYHRTKNKQKERENERERGGRKRKNWKQTCKCSITLPA